MPAELILLLIVFIAVLGLGVPVAVCLGLAAIVSIAAIGDVPVGFMVAQRIATGIASFPLLAIPFFVLSGLLMGEGGMARRLIDLAAALVGRLPGGLAYVTTMTCMMFGAVSGSAVAAVSSIGSFMIPQMTSKGYGRDFSVALTATSATTGLIIPPSNIMIVYAVVAGNVSVAALFMAGFIPGMLVGLCIMAAAFVYNIKTGNQARMEPPPVLPSLVAALPSMLLIAIVLGGILGGVFSATEASAVSVAYALILGVGVYREIPARKLPDILLRSAKTTAVVMLLIGTSQAMSWALSFERVPQTAGEALLGAVAEPGRRAHDHQRAAARGRDVHGHDAGDAHFHADSAARRDGARRGPGALRHYSHHQSLHRPLHAAGRHLFVSRQQRGQHDNLARRPQGDTVLRRDDRCAFADYLHS